MSENEYQVKSLEAVRVAAAVSTVDRDRIGTVVGPNFERLARALREAGSPPGGPGIGFYEMHDDGSVLAGSGFAYDGPPGDGFEIVDLPPAERAVTVLHSGGMDTIGAAWQGLMGHVAAAGRSPAGISREVYLHAPPDDPQGWVTELQQPVGAQD
jgi:effector-binding domain-containing protein